MAFLLWFAGLSRDMSSLWLRHWNIYNIIYETNRQSRFDAWYRNSFSKKSNESSRDPKTYTITWIHAGFLYSYNVNHATETHTDTHTHILTHIKVHAQNLIYPHTIIIICDLSRFLNANSVYSVAKYSWIKLNVTKIPWDLNCLSDERKCYII